MPVFTTDNAQFGTKKQGEMAADKTISVYTLFFVRLLPELRYPQLYSRVGFVHQFHVLSQDETRWLLEQRWNHLGMHIRVDDFTDQEALAAIVRITGGNFRVIHRLLMQIERILEINHLQTVTKEVVEKAREKLVLG